MNLSRGKYIHYCDTMYFTECGRLGVEWNLSEECKWSLGVEWNLSEECQCSLGVEWNLSEECKWSLGEYMLRVVLQKNRNEFSISNFINVQITRWTFIIMDLDQKFSLGIPYLEILRIPPN